MSNADRVANSVDTDCPDQSIPLLRTVVTEWLQGSSILLYIWGIAVKQLEWIEVEWIELEWTGVEWIELNRMERIFIHY